MGIYDNTPIKSSTLAQKKSNTTHKKSKVIGSKKLKDLVKLMKNGPKSAKEILYDSGEHYVGILMQNDEPYLFDEKQIKEFTNLVKEHNFK